MIKGLVLLDGSGYDIPLILNTLGKGRLKRKLYYQIFGKDKPSWEEASPLTFIVKDKTYPPILIFYTDLIESSIIQSRLFFDTLIKRGHRAEIIGVQNKSHKNINKDFGKPKETASIQTLKFLKKIFSS